MCRSRSETVLAWRRAEANRQRSNPSFRGLAAQFGELAALGDNSSCPSAGGADDGGGGGGGDDEDVVDDDDDDDDHDRVGLAGLAISELVLAELVETVSLWAAGEVQATGSDGAVAAEFLEACVLGFSAG